MESTAMDDPEGQDSQLVAVFDDRQAAEAARAALLSAGLPPGSVELVDQVDKQPDPPQPGQASAEPQSSFWGAIARLFAPNEEAEEIGHAVHSGHVMVVVHPADAAERDTAIEALEGCGPIDLDRSKPAGRPEPSAINPAEAGEPVRAQLVRIVEERMRVGRRERPTGRVRSYVAPKPTAGSTGGHRVELLEEEIVPPEPTVRP